MKLKGYPRKKPPGWSRGRRGIAMILVMLVIMVLAVLAGNFASNMSVEAALARNAYNDRRLEWLCHSGVELARYMVGQQFAEQREQYDALNQRWAGGPGTLEDCVLNAVNLNETGTAEGSPLWFLQTEDEDWNNYLEAATLKVKIVDLESRLNINWVAQEYHPRDAIKPVMQDVLKIENTAQDTILDSIADWVDNEGGDGRGDGVRLNGAEWRHYEALGYAPKNGLIDDLSELLLINGIRDEREWLVTGRMPEELDADLHPHMIVPELFTAMSRGRVNVNTAPPEVLQMLLPSMMDYTNQIMLARQGQDGQLGTEFDTPFDSLDQLRDPLIGMDAATVNVLRSVLDVRSMTFEVTVTATVEEQAKTLVSVVRRDDQEGDKVR
ncbi:MAG: hypothetical protein CMO66_02410, partial [Verrucomicrobiales bacterium]|nr:hypothetical protein [Verrucomicrobiales bacterium]